jgi:hypothetical protein
VFPWRSRPGGIVSFGLGLEKRVVGNQPTRKRLRQGRRIAFHFSQALRKELVEADMVSLVIGTVLLGILFWRVRYPGVQPQRAGSVAQTDRRHIPRTLFVGGLVLVDG